jgi:hypothetical protein
VPIGSQGFYRRRGEGARFDQQPIEASGAVSAALQAYRVTGDPRWRSEAWSAFNWARAVALRAKREGSYLGQWMKGLEGRAARNVVIVATANKLARISWAVL